MLVTSGTKGLKYRTRDLLDRQCENQTCTYRTSPRNSLRRIWTYCLESTERSSRGMCWRTKTPACPGEWLSSGTIFRLFSPNLVYVYVFGRFSKKNEAQAAIMNLDGKMFRNSMFPLSVRVADDHSKQKAQMLQKQMYLLNRSKIFYYYLAFVKYMKWFQLKF